MIEFNIPSMSCGHCVGAVTKTVKQVDAAATVHVDLASKKVQVESSLDRTSLAKALDEAGYPPVA
ncbi:MAG: heavy-metal-associated domain-containing protein [Ramlibacter sp.]|nr:heavy-metal-associated domain-containing protein [Ramlibacter sp.]